MATTIYEGYATLYKGVPFDATYQNILEPDTFINKNNLLDSLYDHVEVNKIQTFKINTTTGKGTIRLTVKARDAYDYNYMTIFDYRHGIEMFAFIDGCNYINDGPSDPNTPVEESKNYQCVFEFDITKDVVMSGLLYTSDFMPAPIIRHTATRRFDNPMFPEQFVADEALYKEWSVNEQLGLNYDIDSLSVMFVTYHDQDDYSNLYDIPNGTIGYIFQSSMSCINKIKAMSKSETDFKIHSIYVVPKFVYNGDPTSIPEDGAKIDLATFKSFSNISPFTKSYAKEKLIAEAGAVRNKKCYYYPFTKVRLVSNSGDSCDYAFEYLNRGSSSGNVSFNVDFTGLYPCNITVQAQNYKEASASSDRVTYRRCSSGTYPMGNGSIDTYAQYLNSRTGFAPLVGTHTGGYLGTVADISAIGLQSLIENIGSPGKWIGGVFGETMTAEMMSRKGPTIVGSLPSPDVDYVRGEVDVKIRLVSVKPELMKCLDDYFERFGYAQGGIFDTPDIIGRDRYIYVRTGGKVFNSDACNATENTMINGIFMSGVTIWRKTALTANSGKLLYGSNGEDPINDAI